MNFICKVTAFVAALTLTLSLAACGGQKPAASSEAPAASSVAPASSEAAPASEAPSSQAASPEVSSEASSAPADTALSEADYKTKVAELYAKAVEVAAPLNEIDQSDVPAMFAKGKEILPTAKTIYEELAALKAPETFAAAQADIKEGAEASVKVLEGSVGMLELAASGLSEAEMAVQSAKFLALITAEQSKVQKLTDGLAIVLELDISDVG